MIGTLLLGWILTWFGMDELFIDGINQIFNADFGISIYWLTFFIIGIIKS